MERRKEARFLCTVITKALRRRPLGNRVISDFSGQKFVPEFKYVKILCFF